MSRSAFTIDLGAVRHNVHRLLAAASGSELWVVVKADGYGHGAVDVGRAALAAGASALCVATAGEAAALRAGLPDARIVVLGPADAEEVRAARTLALELVVSVPAPLPDGVRVHVKLDTGMGRWGLSELPALTSDVVGLMSHFATADSDLAFAERQLERFLAVTNGLAGAIPRHIANSAATLSLPASHLDAVRCGIAVYGISPFGDDPGRHGLRPALRWESTVADVRLLRAGDSTGYGRRFVASEDTWIALVPVGYADGFRRDMEGTEVLVASERRRVVGTVSMDAIAVALEGPVEHGAPVTLIGDDVTIEQHARVADTIGYEIACGLTTRSPRGEREVRDV